MSSDGGLGGAPLARAAESGRYSLDHLQKRVIQAVEHWIEVANTHGKSRNLPTVPRLPVLFDLKGCNAGMFSYSIKAGVVVNARVRINLDLLERYPG